MWGVETGTDRPALVGAPAPGVEVRLPDHDGNLPAALADLVGEYQARCDRAGARTAAERARVRVGLFADAGGLDHGHVRGVVKLSTMMKWPAAATLKDLRHLLATMLNNAGVPVG